MSWFVVVDEARRRLCRDGQLRAFANFGTESSCVITYRTRGSANRRAQRRPALYVIEVPDGAEMDACGRISTESLELDLDHWQLATWTHVASLLPGPLGRTPEQPPSWQIRRMREIWSWARSEWRGQRPRGILNTLMKRFVLRLLHHDPRLWPQPRETVQSLLESEYGETDSELLCVLADMLEERGHPAAGEETFLNVFRSMWLSGGDPSDVVMPLADSESGVVRLLPVRDEQTASFIRGDSP